MIKRGYDIPYSAGLEVNYVTQESDILIRNLKVGFNNGELINLDEFINFPTAIAREQLILGGWALNLD